MGETKPKLTAREQIFVQHFLLLGNKSDAIRATGYKGDNAANAGYKMAIRPLVAAAIAEGQAARAERLELDSDGVLKRLREEAEADLADIYEPNSRTLKPVDKWPIVWRKGLVAGVKTRELFTGPPKDRVKIGEEVDVRIAPRLPRLKLIGDHTKVGAFVKPDKEGVHETLREFFDAVKNHGGIGPKTT